MKSEFNNWEELVLFLRRKYNLSGNINSVLFFIGVHESGKGFRSYSRDEKAELILLGQKIVSDKYSIEEGLSQDPSFTEKTGNKYQEQIRSFILRYFNSLKIQL